MTEIGFGAFSGSDICDVHLPGTLKTIGANAFNQCHGIESIELPDGLAEIKDGAFSLSALKMINIPGTVEKIGDFAFENCNYLQKIIIQEGVKEIGEFAFYLAGFYAEKTDITLPSSIEKIGGVAFDETNKQTSLYCLTPTLPQLGYHTFDQSMQIYLHPTAYQQLTNQEGNYKDWTINVEPIQTHLNDEFRYNYEFDYFSDLIVPDASYRRTFKDGIWEGICLPFELKYEEWCEKGEMAEWVDFIDDNTLVWQIIGEGGKTIAGRPYIFKKHDTNIENETVFSATNTILRSSQEIYPAYTRYFMLTGSYGMLPMMEGMSIYDYVNGEYCKNESPDNLTPYRIYLQALPEFPVNVKNIVVDKVEDAINGIAGKVQGKTYNLQGVEVNAGYKGIVIQNGKKLLKK